MLSVVVFNHDDLSGEFVVSEAGTISPPLVGEIPAARRTVEAVGQDYADLLANGYLVEPHVSASINKYRPFFIIGGVKRPGAYPNPYSYQCANPYQSCMTILQAIALAGGRIQCASVGEETPDLCTLFRDSPRWYPGLGRY